MRIEYGPPGHKGVTQIMGLGANSDIEAIKAGGVKAVMDKPSRTVGLLSAATVVGGMVLGSSTARNIGIGGLLAVVYIQMLKPKAPTTAVVPNSVQGWG
jgi:hypothetical protein